MHVFSRSVSAVVLISLLLSLIALISLIGLAGCGSGDDDTSQPGKAELRRLFGPSSEALPKAGAKLVAVPELVGVPSGPSTRKLQSRGLYLSARFPGRIGNAQLKPECGYTFSHQSPAAGTRVPKGSTVVAVSDLCPKFKRKPHRGSGPD